MSSVSFHIFPRCSRQKPAAQFRVLAAGFQPGALPELADVVQQRGKNHILIVAVFTQVQFTSISYFPSPKTVPFPA